MKTPSYSCTTPRLLGGPSGAGRLRQELRSRFEDCAFVASLSPPNHSAKQRIPVRSASFWSYTAPLISKWIKPELRLELLVPDILKEGKYKTWALQTRVREGVFVWSGHGFAEVSQDEYKALKVQQETGKAPQPQEQTATVSKLSVSSNPDGAEIDVDGALMGSTPSVIELNVGPHTITLNKSGYKPWERKMALVTGEINLNADLEPATPK